MIHVNGVAIDDEQISREAQYHPAPDFFTARAEAAQALVVRELLRQEAFRRGLDAGLQPRGGVAEDEALIEALLGDAIEIPDADEAACRRYYENNRAKYRSADIFEASHILIPARMADAEARAGALAKAESLIAELGGRPERFAELARQHSACSSAQNGGDLGQITRGQTTQEFETFLYSTEPGTICPVPVPTPYGYHVLYLRRRVDGRALPFEAAKDMIARGLRERAWRYAVHQFVQILIDAADIDGIDLPKNGSPLVQ